MSVSGRLICFLAAMFLLLFLFNPHVINKPTWMQELQEFGGSQKTTKWCNNMSITRRKAIPLHPGSLEE